MLPNFLIIGAAKSGTTSLYYYLKQHPDIFLPDKKELNYFSIHFERIKFSDYEKYFRLLKNENEIGEASPSYLYYENTPKRISTLLPKCKFIIILRNPIERFISDFFYLQTKGFNLDVDINKFVKDFFYKDDLEINILESPENLIWKGFYCKHILNYYKYFNKENFFIGFFDDLLNNPQELLKNICDFLGVDDSFRFETNIKYNKGKYIKNNYLLKLVYKYRNIIKIMFPFIKNKNDKWIKIIKVFYVKKNKSNNVIRTDTLNKLKRIYSNDIESLSGLLNKDITHWLTK